MLLGIGYAGIFIDVVLERHLNISKSPVHIVIPTQPHHSDLSGHLKSGVIFGEPYLKAKLFADRLLCLAANDQLHVMYACGRVFTEDIVNQRIGVWLEGSAFDRSKFTHR